jgi:hypothetical protein
MLHLPSLKAPVSQKAVCLSSLIMVIAVIVKTLTPVVKLSWVITLAVCNGFIFLPYLRRRISPLSWAPSSRPGGCTGRPSKLYNDKNTNILNLNNQACLAVARLST